jgi:hypothetical protein
MRAIDPIKAGLVLGTLMGGLHLVWALLVAVGWAQAIVNFVLWIHFIKPIYLVEPFDIGTAALLVAVTGFAGFVIAFLFGMLWNHLHRM